MKILGTTNDLWARELISQLPKTNKKIIILASAFTQAFLTIPAKILRYKIIWICSRKEYSAISAPLARIMSHIADAIIAPNQAIEAQILRARIKNKKMQVIYPWCNFDTHIHPDKHKITLACDGAIQIDQGMGLLLHAIASVKQIIPNIKLIIGGQIANPQKIQWIVKQLRLDSAVQVVPTNKKTWMASSNIYILPTEADWPVPCSLAQSMALSKAIIATNKLSHHEFITQNKNGILIKQNNVDMLSQAIINLARKPEWIRELGQNNRAFAIQRFPKEIFNQKINAILSMP